MGKRLRGNLLIDGVPDLCRHKLEISVVVDGCSSTPPRLHLQHPTGGGLPTNIVKEYVMLAALLALFSTFCSCIFVVISARDC